MVGRRRSRGDDGASTPAGSAAGTPAGSVTGSSPRRAPDEGPASPAPETPGATAVPGTGEPPLITVGPASGAPALPHWAGAAGRRRPDAGEPEAPPGSAQRPEPAAREHPVDAAGGPADGSDEQGSDDHDGARGPEPSGRRRSLRRAVGRGADESERPAGLAGAVPSGLPPSGGDHRANGAAATAADRLAGPASSRARSTGAAGPPAPGAADRPAAPVAGPGAEARSDRAAPGDDRRGPVAPVPAPSPGTASPVDALDPTATAAATVDTGAAPTARWRAADGDWTEGEGAFADLAGDGDGDTNLGALDERDRLLDEQYLTFEDLDVPRADMPTVPPRGSAEDPIRIQRAGGAPTGASAMAAVSGTGEGGEGGGDPAPGEPAGPLHRRPEAPGAGADPGAGAAAPASPAPRGPARSPSPASAGSDPPGDGADPGDRSAGRNRAQAIKVGMTIAVAALAVFLVGAFTPLRWLPLVLVVAAVVCAMIELFNAATRAGFKPLNLVGVAAGIALPVLAYLSGTPTLPDGESGMVLVLFLSLGACMAWYLFGAGRGRAVPNIALTLLGITYVGMLGSYAALILRAGPWPGSGTTIDQGIPLILLVVVGTELYDAGGYLLGSRLGRTPLSAASPSKTREGLVLGMACAMASIVVMGGVLGIGVRSLTEAVILAAVVAVVAPLGDLFESMLKRDLGVKDMSDLIPSHGGLLDRVDALLFTLPCSYYTLRMLGLL